MSDVDVIPEIKQIIGAILFAAKEPVSIAQMKHVFVQTAEQYGGVTKDFAEITDDMLEAAVKELNDTLAGNAIGLHVREVANGYRLANDASCGSWLRVLLEKGKASRLSRPALETLAIIAYRQPVVRSEIEAVRGVAVDQMIRNLLDLQLIRVVGRSELPGRPWMFGTTQKFLEHFGIKSVNDLPGTEELRRLEAEQLKRKQAEQTELSIEEQAVESDDEGALAEEPPEATPDEDDRLDGDVEDDVDMDEPDDAAPEQDDEFVEEEQEDEFDDDDDDEFDDDDDEDDEDR